MSRGFRWRRSPFAVAAIVLLLVLVSGPSLQAEPERPDLPRSRVKIYDADPLTCRAPVIEAAFRSHLAPWADQPEAVQQRLRILQGELTRSTLERCLQKGLMNAEQVKEVEQRLGLPATTGGAAPQPASPAAPQPTGSPVRP